MRVKNLEENVLDTFKNMKAFHKEKVSFGKVKKINNNQTTYLNEEERDRRKDFLKENPKKTATCATYWKTKPVGKDFRKEHKRRKMETEDTDNGKVHYCHRSVTDKIVSRPMSSHIF